MKRKQSRQNNETSTTLDTVDADMIRLLQKDGRMSNIEIAKNLGISETTVRNRLKKLIDEKYIQIVAVSDPFKLGFEMTGDLYIHVEMRKLERVVSELKKIKELWYIVITTGNTYINAEFVVKSRDALNDLIFNKISKIDGVTRTEVAVIMKYEKRAYDWGVIG
jgi:Lrp/AsnC family transcriptional regulator for asnA, asnC and gidA